MMMLAGKAKPAVLADFLVLGSSKGARGISKQRKI
jgi:hypothetical protein